MVLSVRGAQAPAQPLQLAVRPSTHGTVVDVDGELDVATAPALEEALAAQAGSVIVDLRDLTYIGSCGVRVLLEADRRARRDGREFKLMPGRVAEWLLRLTSAHDQFDFADAESSTPNPNAGRRRPGDHVGAVRGARYGNAA